MSVASKEVERRVELMKDALRARGMRLTHQRIEVVREIAASDEHPDVEHIFRSVRTRVPTISLDTVYRTLATLVELGCVTRTTLTPGPARYDANLEHHHHYVCTRCGTAHDIVDPGLDEVRPSAAAAGLGRVETVEVRLRGVCVNCESRDSARRTATAAKDPRGIEERSTHHD